MKPLSFGEVTVERLVEAEGPGFYPAFILPESGEDALAGEMSWLLPHFFHPRTGRFVMSQHSFVVRTPRHTILIDTCVGNDKERPSTPGWHRQRYTWLEDLKAMGVRPEDVDVVLCTHLHVDHVGWNTRLANGRWVPTFPNARYLFHEKEYAHWESHEMANVGAGSTEGSFEDSVMPVVEAGLADLVAGDYQIEDGLWLEATPGHTPGHVCLHLQAGGARAVFSGDLLHHPVQCAYPEWNSRYCWDAALSRATRQAFVERHADQDVLILAAHFAAPTAGRIESNGDRCRFQP